MNSYKVAFGSWKGGKRWAVGVSFYISRCPVHALHYISCQMAPVSLTLSPTAILVVAEKELIFLLKDLLAKDKLLVNSFWLKMQGLSKLLENLWEL